MKTPTSDMTEGALGGNIDVRTFRPFDVGNKVTANLRGTYTSQTKKVKPNATLIGSHTFGDTFAAVFNDLADTALNGHDAENF